MYPPLLTRRLHCDFVIVINTEIPKFGPVPRLHSSVCVIYLVLIKKTTLYDFMPWNLSVIRKTDFIIDSKQCLLCSQKALEFWDGLWPKPRALILAEAECVSRRHRHSLAKQKQESTDQWQSPRKSPWSLLFPTPTLYNLVGIWSSFSNITKEKLTLFLELSKMFWVSKHPGQTNKNVVWLN